MTITELAIKRPTLIVVIFLALGLLGTFGYTQLRYELLPKVAPPWVVISTAYPGASPAEVENSVTKPIEDAVASVEKLSNTIGNSYEGLSVISLEYKYSANVDQAMQEVQRKINGILLSLPKDIRTPVVQKFSLDEVPVLKMGVSSDMPPREFYQFLKDEVEPAFGKIEGVGQVKVIGGDIREIKVNLDLQKVRAYGLSIAHVTQIINASNLDFPTGAVKGQERQSIVRISGKFPSIQDMRNLIVSHASGGGNVRLGDVAEIEDGIQEYTTLSRLNGRNSIGINIIKQTDANTVEVCDRMKAAIRELEEQYHSVNLRFEVVADASLFTIDAANAVKEDLLMAVLLVAAVMFLFLHSVRNSLMVLIAIPASLIASTLAMWALDYSLNLMTLLALSLVIGILVDDSIVVLENIHHHLEKGEKAPDAALRGRNEIGFAALSITLVDVVVFVPLTLIVGLVGDIMREFAVVIVVSTLMSLFVSFTLTPMLASRFAKIEHLAGGSVLGMIANRFEAGFRSLVRFYLKVLQYSLGNRGKVFAAAVVLFVASLALPALGVVGSEFIKASDRGEFIVNLETPPGSTLEHTGRVAMQIEQMIGRMPETKKIMANIGLGAQNVVSSNVATIYVALVDKDRRKKSTDEVTNDIKGLTGGIPGIRVFIDQIAITGEQAGIGIMTMVRGSNPDSLLKMTGLVAAAMRKTSTVTDIKFSYEQSNPETRVEVDRQKMAAYGLTVYDVGTTLRVALTGDDGSKFREGQKEYPIRVVLDKFDRSNPQDVAHLSFVTPQGQQVELQQLAEIYPASGPTKLERYNRTSSIMVTGYVDNTKPLGNVTAEFQQRLGNQHVSGTSVEFVGDEKNRSESFGQLGLALLASIVFVYLIMVALYDSFVYPFVVLFSIPLALIGAMIMLAITGSALSIFSALGIIMMVGLVAKNAILLVDRTNENKERRMATGAALIEAGQARIRPIFMTTLSMVFGMLPIALAKGAGSEWKNGLAWALIGGLTSSMFLTLVIVPVVYTWLDRWRRLAPVLFQRPFAFVRLRRIRKARGRTSTGIAETSARLLVLLLTLGGLVSHPVLAQGSKATTIAVVVDGPWERNEEVRNLLHSAVAEVVGRDASVVFSPDSLIVGDWALPTIHAINDRLLGDPGIAMVIGMGLIASQDLATRGPLPKPVIAPIVVDVGRQHIPAKDGVSGVRNLNYLVYPQTFERDLELFREIIPIHTMVNIASAPYDDVLPPSRIGIRDLGRKLGVDITELRIGFSADSVIAALPKDADAVFLEPAPNVPPAEFAKLVQAFIDRRLPSFCFLGEHEVQQGIMASANPDLLPRLIRRIALNIQRIVQGEEPGSISTSFTPGKRLTINLNTAYAVGVSPKWNILLEAELVKVDTLVPGATSLTLSDAIHRFSEDNLDVQARIREVEAAASDVGIARSALLPKLDLTATGYQIDKDRAQAGGLPERSATAEASATQVLFAEPALANLSIQSSLQESREQDLVVTRLNTVVDGVQLYLNYLRARRIFYILIDNLKLTRTNLELARVRQSTGAAGPEEALRWEVEIASLRKSTMDLQSLMNQALLALKQALNFPLLYQLNLHDVSLDDPTFLISSKELRGYLEEPITFDVLNDFLASEGSRRAPELKQIDAVITSQERALTSLQLGYFLPTISAFGKYSDRFYKSDIVSPFQLPSLSAAPPPGTPGEAFLYQVLGSLSPKLPDDRDWSVGVQLSLNIFNGFGTRAAQQQTSITLDKYRIQRKAIEDRVALRIRLALERAKASYFAIQQAKLEQDAARKTLNIVTESYSQGAVSILSLLDAQNSALRSDQVAANALYDFLGDYFALQRGVGEFDVMMSGDEKADLLRRLTDRISAVRRQ